MSDTYNSTQILTNLSAEYFAIKGVQESKTNDKVLMDEFSSLLNQIAGQVFELKKDVKTTKESTVKEKNQNETKSLSQKIEKKDYIENKSSPEKEIKKSDSIEKKEECNSEEKEELKEVVDEEDSVECQQEEGATEKVLKEVSTENLELQEEKVMPVDESIQNPEDVILFNQQDNSQLEDEEVELEDGEEKVEASALTEVELQTKTEDVLVKEDNNNETGEEKVSIEIKDSSKEEEPVSDNILQPSGVEEIVTENHEVINLDQVDETPISSEKTVLEKVELLTDTKTEESLSEDIETAENQEISDIIGTLKAKVEDSGEASEAIVAELPSNTVGNFDVTSSYAQLWQAQNMPEVSNGSVSTLYNSIKVSSEQSIQNTLVQGVNGTNIEGNLNSTQIEKDFAASKEARMLTRAQVTSMMSRVEDVLKEVARTKDGKTISIKLNPEELGNLKIDVSIRDSKLHARLVAENPAVSQALRENASDLQRVLKESGIDVEDVSVSVGSNEGSFNESMQQQTRERTKQGVRSHGIVREDSGKNVKKTFRNESLVSDHWIA